MNEENQRQREKDKQGIIAAFRKTDNVKSDARPPATPCTEDWLSQVDDRIHRRLKEERTKWEDKVCSMLAETQAANLHYVQAHISASNDSMSARIDALIPNLMVEMKKFVGQSNHNADNR